MLLVVLVARRTGQDGFAAFSFAYVLHTVVVGLTSAFIGQPLVLVRDPDALRPAAARALAFTAVASLAVAAPIGVAGLALRSEVGRTLAALAAVLTVMLLQEVSRLVFAAFRLPHLAFATDTIKVAALAATLLLLADADPARTVLLWGLSTVPALLLSLALALPRTARPGAVVRPMLDAGNVGRRFAVEFAVGNGASQLTILGLGVFANPLTVGALRGASTLFGPLNVLHTATTSFGPPYLGRLTAPRDRVRAAARIATVLAAVAATWGGFVGSLPDRVGRQVLGDTWEAAHALVPATGAQYVAMATGAAAILALRVTEPRATLGVQVVFSAVNVVTTVLGYLAWGTIGAAWGLMAGSALKSIALWQRARHRGRQDADRDPT